MARVVIKTLPELKNLQTKLRALGVSLPKLQQAALNEIANDEVLEVIHRKMKAENFSEKIIDATFVGKTEIVGNKSRTHFISNYESDDGFDVSVAREEGTRDHVVRPKKPGGTLRWFAQTGEPIFAKISRPKGIQRLLIIEKTIRQFETVAIPLYQARLVEKVQRVLGV